MRSSRILPIAFVLALVIGIKFVADYNHAGVIANLNACEIALNEGVSRSRAVQMPVWNVFSGPTSEIEVASGTPMAASYARWPTGQRLVLYCESRQWIEGD